MTCRDVRDAMELFVLGALAGPQHAAVESHLEACPACRAAEEECRLLVSEVQLSAGAATPRPAFERSLRAAVAAEADAQRGRARARRALAAVGSVAAVLLAAALGWRLWPVARGTGPATVAAAERWRYESVHGGPGTVADGVVVQGAALYVLQSDGRRTAVVGIDAATGTPQWATEVGSPGYLAADPSRVYCLSAIRPAETELIALDATDGRVLWRFAQDGLPRLEEPSRPVPLPRDRVCWTAGRQVHLVDATVGKTVWTHSISDEGPLSCAVALGDALHVVTARAVRCLDTATGEETWSAGLGTDRRTRGRPVLALGDGRAYFVLPRLGQGAQLFCMDLATRSLMWQRAAPGARSLLAADGAVYVRGERVQALDGGTGRPRWSLAAEGCGPLTHADGLLHFVDTSGAGRLIAVEAHTGTQAWQIAGIRSCDAFTRLGTTGYIKTQDGIVHAIVPGAPGRS